MAHEDYLTGYLPKQRSRCAINVGAHQGIWAERLSPLFERTIAVEADPGNAEILRGKNLPGVEVLDAAGWITSGQMMEFNRRGGLDMQGALACRDPLRTSQITETIRVPTVSIDDLPKDNCDLIIVDVEGAEIQVMMGATLTVERFHPDLMIECHEVEHFEWLRCWLSRAGYNVAQVHHSELDMSDQRWPACTHLIANFYRYRGSF